MSDHSNEMRVDSHDYRSSGLRDDRDDRGGARRKFFRRKVCRVCIGKVKIDYKESDALSRFTTERGKILPRRITGTCARHQRLVAREIKRARILALLPFVAS